MKKKRPGRPTTAQRTGREGGLKASAKLTPEQRRAKAQAAAAKRWKPVFDKIVTRGPTGPIEALLVYDSGDDQTVTRAPNGKPVARIAPFNPEDYRYEGGNMPDGQSLAIMALAHRAGPTPGGLLAGDPKEAAKLKRALPRAGSNNAKVLAAVTSVKWRAASQIAEWAHLPMKETSRALVSLHDGGHVVSEGPRRAKLWRLA